MVGDGALLSYGRVVLFHLQHGNIARLCWLVTPSHTVNPLSPILPPLLTPHSCYLLVLSLDPVTLTWHLCFFYENMCCNFVVFRLFNV